VAWPRSGDGAGVGRRRQRPIGSFGAAAFSLSKHARAGGVVVDSLIALVLEVSAAGKER
jgi:hypothetical protein